MVISGVSEAYGGDLAGICGAARKKYSLSLGATERDESHCLQQPIRSRSLTAHRWQFHDRVTHIESPTSCGQNRKWTTKFAIYGYQNQGEMPCEVQICWQFIREVESGRKIEVA